MTARPVSPQRVHRRIGAALLLLWALSLAFPVAIIREGDVWHGWMVLAFGFLGMMNWQLGWLANWVFLPATIAGMVMKRPSRRVLVAVLVMLIPPVAGAIAWREVVYDDGVHTIARFGLGYFLWLAAMLGCIIWHGVRLRG
ncbi:MAG: hypothetical protein C0476_08930 [Sphingomonas sp.]|nr:hypothetical protein [Sphingomonas sp.]